MSYRVDENGNYKRTVRCGYCYELGHNKGSCQAKKQNHLDYIATYEKEIADDNFVDDWERDHSKAQAKPPQGRVEQDYQPWQESQVLLL